MKMHSSFIAKFLTILRLGILNVIRVLTYRLRCKLGYYAKILPTSHWKTIHLDTCFFPLASKSADIKRSSIVAEANKIMAGKWRYFFNSHFDLKTTPDWLYNPFTLKKWSFQNSHWSKLQYFSHAGEDIKVIWDLSRFYWAPILAAAYKETSDPNYLFRLNSLVQDWTKQNLPQVGYQWLCAQEAGIRLINLLLSDYILCDSNSSTLLIELVNVHLHRINVTLSYAISQDNNHATSEAAALYIGGWWLSLNADTVKSKNFGKLVHDKGMGLLERHVNKLIMSDGTFSQYSVTYHRMVLDTLSLCILIQKKFNLKPFSKTFYQQQQKLLDWLCVMTDPLSGASCNLGSNDGTMLFKLDNCDYRDFRPSLQLASVLLNNSCLFPEGPWNAPLQLLEIAYKDLPIESYQQKSIEFKAGGFVKFFGRDHWGVLNYPCFKFRPSQCDALHFDLWVKGINVLRDNGSYSYHAEVKLKDKFSSVEAHNTVQFDQHDQMPRLSKFLLGAWLKTDVIQRLREEEGYQSWVGQYTDFLGATHYRKIELKRNVYVITDKISGYKEKAILRWHLALNDWKVLGNSCVSSKVKITVAESNTLLKPVLKTSFYSLYYQHYQEAPMLEFEFKAPTAEIVTTIEVMEI